MCVYSTCKLGIQPKSGDRSAQISTGRVESCKGKRYRAKEIVAERSKVMQGECELYEGGMREETGSAYTRGRAREC